MRRFLGPYKARACFATSVHIQHGLKMAKILFLFATLLVLHQALAGPYYDSVLDTLEELDDEATYSLDVTQALLRGQHGILYQTGLTQIDIGTLDIISLNYTYLYTYNRYEKAVNRSELDLRHCLGNSRNEIGFIADYTERNLFDCVIFWTTLAQVTTNNSILISEDTYRVIDVLRNSLSACDQEDDACIRRVLGQIQQYSNLPATLRQIYANYLGSEYGHVAEIDSCKRTAIIEFNDFGENVLLQIQNCIEGDVINPPPPPQ